MGGSLDRGGTDVPQASGKVVAFSPTTPAHLSGMEVVQESLPVNGSDAVWADNVARLPRLLDVHGVAEVLGVTVRHVRRLVADRRIPYLKWGHYVRFDPDDIQRWLKAARIDCAEAGRQPPRAG